MSADSPPRAVKEKPLPVLHFYVRDYIAATRSMSLAERGAYCDLLFLEWDSGPLPKEPVRLASMLGCSRRTFLPIWEAIKGKFVETAAGYVNERLERERELALLKRTKASSKAATAAAARWTATLGDAVRRASVARNGSDVAPSNASSTVGSMLRAMLEQCPPASSSSSGSSSNPTNPPEPAASRKRARPATPDGARARIDTPDERAQRLDLALRKLPMADDALLKAMVTGSTLDEVAAARRRAAEQAP